MENLTQAERNLLYELRRFTRFRKEFSLAIASSLTLGHSGQSRGFVS